MNDTSISVSIIVPNYNYACYLNVRIASILNQSYTNYELILLDDASTDNSVEILEKYKDNPHVSHILVNEKNSGSPFQQWAKGISLARGKWIWIAEADDVAEPWGKHRHRMQAHCFDGKAYAEHNMYWNNCVMNASGVLFRRDYAMKLKDSLFLNMRYSGDWVFWFQMLLQGDMIEVYEKLNYFRQHTAKVSAEGIATGNRIFPYDEFL